MAKKITVKGCPCCGAPAFWTIGNRETRMNDRTVCLECDLEMEGDYTPQSSLVKWNWRVAGHYVKDRVWNINGELCE